ncbi:pentapeptide repeat-containing protein [Streptomyces sp. NPDC004232]|uniref:pentapeptide repeat-containing protein n=1 Tax=Streptomyces sp. NPDC004232 TaxID=3154454 RepID=UPI0033A06A79
MRNLGVKFEDSNLEGAHFNGADLRGVDFLGAHFAGAEFDGANLKGADLRSADLSHTNISYAKDLQGALVNAQTCWPHGFLNNPNFNGYQLHRWEWIDPNSGKKVTSYGREWPACGERLS